VTASSPEAEALVERRGRAGVIVLNRPKALNALTLTMVRLIGAALDEWKGDHAVDRVLFLGAGERAFCAGGDIRRLYELGRAGDHDAQLTFWREEYQLDLRIKTYPKPIVALMDGIVMGGGVGLAMHAGHTVAGERFVFAMPEVGIGFFPDVGASWLLPRLPSHAGVYFALTGLRANAGDAVAFGLAQTFVPSAAFPALAQALASLDDASDELHVALLAIAIGFVLVVAGLAVVLRNTAIRPVHRLAAEARRVADGDFGHEVAQTGPREIRALAADVNTMRLRILRELATVQEANEALAEHAAGLQRSNAELEQFAYVASHDLQEPLRKVTSFCQLLQRRYGGQLDERADQYIDFAVDGAKRMQVLINDLLAFSRAGRSAEELGPVACDAALATATANLSTQIAETGAVIEAGPLPVVRGQLTLMSVVFQNLLGNALKFTGEQPPRIVITAERDGAFWSFSVTDNGIGIEPEYANRVFLIFQRLHERAAYPGTGIGLAMCRKIIEYFGGRIWLDTGVGDGARFCFTVPALADDEGTDG